MYACLQVKRGATASTSKKKKKMFLFKFFCLGVQSLFFLYIYTDEYIDVTALCVNLYISIT